MVTSLFCFLSFLSAFEMKIDVAKVPGEPNGFNSKSKQQLLSARFLQ